jgi:hypothetical protein
MPLILPLFFGPDNSGVYLLLYLLIAIVMIYTVGFAFFFYLAHLDGPTSIRASWTVGLVWYLLYLMTLSDRHARYLAFWRGEPSLVLPNMLLLVALIVAFLFIIWLKKPRLE